MPVLTTGSVFAGYRLEGVAGRGGMGVVYRARQLRPDRLVAVKVIAPELAQDTVFRQRFERESELAASIEHPNVIPVYEVNEVDELLFIAMRFVEGKDLHKLIGEGVEPELAVEIVEQVGAALDAAHERGLVHRDVKPANVLIGTTGGQPHAYLTDFGLTKRTAASGGLTRTGMFMGTVDYAAPEQIMGDPIDSRTDVYALSCVLYQALTGEVPYPRESDVATVYAHMQEPPPSLADQGLDLPPTIDHVIHRGMAKQPGERYQSAGDLARAARAVMEGAAPPPERRSVQLAQTVVDEPPPRAPSPPAQVGGRPRWIIPVVGAAAALVVTVLAVLALSGGEDTDGGKGKRGLRVAWQAPVGGAPVYAAIADDKVWVSLFRSDRLTTIDPDSRDVAETGRLGSDLSGLATNGKRLFVADYGEDDSDGRGMVHEVDLVTGDAVDRPIPAPEPVDIASDGRSLWVVADSGAVEVIDLRSRIRTKVDFDGTAFDVAVSGGTAWVIDNDSGGLHGFDARTGESRGRPVDVGTQPTSVAVGGGNVWVATAQGQLVRVPVDGGRQQSRAVGGEGRRSVEVGAQGVWVVDENGKVVLVDPDSLRLLGLLQLGGDLQNMAVDRGGAWVLRERSRAGSTVARVTPPAS